MGHGSHQWKGTAYAIVTSVDDPEKRGRVKVNGRSLTSDGADVELDVWVPPKSVVNYGLHLPPRVGDVVGVEFTSGDTGDTAHGETFLRDPDFQYTGAVRRDEEDIDLDFSDLDYNNLVGYKEPGALSGWVIDRDSGNGYFWGGNTYLGDGPTGGPWERTVGGAALGYWFEDFFTHLDRVIGRIYNILDWLRYWGDPTQPTQGWPVVNDVAKPPPGDTSDIVDKLAELDTYWDKLVGMEGFIGGWQHDNVFLLDIEGAYEPGEGL